MSANDSSEDLTQASYRATPYEDQEWEVVGEFTGDETFIPAEFQVLGGSTLVVDPMFADYGGLPPPAEKRSHVPITRSAGSGRWESGINTKEQEEAVDTRLRISQEELDAKIAEAREMGKLDALTEAISHQQEKLERLQSQINIVLSDIDTQFKERIILVEQQSVDLAVEISKKLINDAVEINPEYILPIVSEAISKVGTATIRSVRVSPEDLEFINIIGIEKQLKEFDGTWDFQADETIRSGCIVETSSGEVDFDLDRAWDRLKDKIRSVRA